MKRTARKALQISGPPCSGKSTRLQELAANGWIVLDDWEFHRQQGATSRDAVSPGSWQEWHKALDRALASHGPPVAFIQGRPVPRRRGVVVQLLDPGEEECHRRADEDDRPQITHKWITEWYRKRNASRTRYAL